MKRSLMVVSAFLVGLAAAPRAHALPAEGGAVTSLSIRPSSGRAEVVVGVDGAVRVQDFVMHGPEKIVLDITGASLGMANHGYDRVARGGIVDIRYSQFRRGVVRVVVTLDSPHRYTVSQQDGTVHLSIETERSEFASWRTGSEGNARVAVHVDEQAAIIPQGDTPDRAITPDQKDPKAQFTALTGPLFQQSTQPRITIAFQDSPIADVLSAFAAFSGRTIIPARDVKGQVTAEIADKPWDVAMRAILNANGFDAREDAEGIIVVDTYESIAARGLSEPLITRTFRLNYTRAYSAAGPVRERLSRQCVVPSANTANNNGNNAASGNAGASANPGAPAATGGNGSTSQTGLAVTTDLRCPQRGAVTADSLTNSISITDVARNIEPLEAYARSLDLRQPQVNIKAKIILVDRTQLEALGIKYDLGTKDHFFNTLAPRLDSLGQQVTTAGAGIFNLGGNALAALANASGVIPNAALQLVYSAALGKYDLTTFLEALQDVSLLDVQAEPSVTTLTNRTADLSAGTQVPIRVVEAGSGTGARATVSFRQTGVVLQVTPQITNNRQILMSIHAENSDVQFQSGDVGAVFPTQSVNNEMLVADGETAVVGGLTQTRVSVTKSGIPVLVDLPFIGRLFGVTNKQETKRDLLILITPHIIDEGEAPVVPPTVR